MSEENGESSDEEVIVVDDFESPTVPYVVGAVDIASSSPFYDNDCTEENLPSGNSSPSKSPVKKKVRSVPSRRNLFNIYENEPENEISDDSIMTNDNNDPRFEKNASELESQLGYPLFSENHTDNFMDVAQIFAFEAKDSDKVCAGVPPQVCPISSATFLVDIDKLSAPQDIYVDAYGIWGKSSGKNRYFTFDVVRAL